MVPNGFYDVFTSTLMKVPSSNVYCATYINEHDVREVTWGEMETKVDKVKNIHSVRGYNKIIKNFHNIV